jgi:hypothetical protein
MTDGFLESPWGPDKDEDRRCAFPEGSSEEAGSNVGPPAPFFDACTRPKNEAGPSVREGRTERATLSSKSADVQATRAWFETDQTPSLRGPTWSVEGTVSGAS